MCAHRLSRHRLHGAAQTDRHHFNKAHVNRPVARKHGQAAQLVLVDAGKRYAVDLDAQPGVDSRAQPAPYSVKTVAPGDFGVNIWPQRIQADVDSVHADFTKTRYNLLEQHAVSRDCDMLDAGQRLDLFDQLTAAVPHKRFASGNFDIAHAQLCCGAADTDDFLIAQDLIVLNKRLVLRHTIPAAQIASVRDGYAHIIDTSSAGINHFYLPFGARNPCADCPPSAALLARPAIRGFPAL